MLEKGWFVLTKGAFRPRGIGARESESQRPKRVVGLWKKKQKQTDALVGYAGVPVRPGCFVSTKAPSVQEG